VLDDVPDRRAPPGLGARGAGGRAGREPDHGRPRDHRVGQGGARADAQHHL
ncbi:MAG: Quinolinate synthetase, partial [uncultured Phycisphaerae bacterium]